jgi:pantoate--beta-alanine ligase
MTSPRRTRVLSDPRAVRRQVRAWRTRGDRVAFVPTMGYFHDGHLSLMRRARRAADRTVVSIFVNPTQFAPNEDFATYPRDLKRDLKLARDLGMDLCFTPSEKAMYGSRHVTEIHVQGLEDVLEGKTRPTHFSGVAIVVAKLLLIVEPDVLVLGQKDAQQAVILERMIEDLGFSVRVVRGATVREPGGLALSSRNTRLTDRQREAARVLWRALRRARDTVKQGERSAARIKNLIRREVRKESMVRLDYAAVVRADTLADLSRLEGRVLIPIAGYVGGTRLIDNVELTVPRSRR